MEPGRRSVTGRVLLEGKPVHIVDVLADPEYAMVEAQKRAGFRTVLGVPLVREGTAIGVLHVLRTTVHLIHAQAPRSVPARKHRVRQRARLRQHGDGTHWRLNG